MSSRRSRAPEGPRPFVLFLLGRGLGGVCRRLVLERQPEGREVDVTVPDADPLVDHSAKFGILRINRQLSGENTLGFIYTDRELDTSVNTVCTSRYCNALTNRVGGFDSHFRFNRDTEASFQAVKSRSQYNDGTSLGGHDIYGQFRRITRKGRLQTTYTGTSTGFETLAGFFQRPDIRDWQSVVQYTKYENGGFLNSHGIQFKTDVLWDQSGLRNNYLGHLQYNLNFTRQTNLSPYVEWEHERLRPIDFSGLLDNRDYGHHQVGMNWFSRFNRWLKFNGTAWTGVATNYASPDNVPRLSNAQNLQFQFIVRGGKGITVENTYLWARLHDKATDLTAFNDHIFRQKWNLQFTREMSLRFITQYEATLANPLLAALPKRRNLNFDVLFTYMWHPQTALYVGYNSNLQNLDRALAYDPNIGDFRRAPRLYNDGRQVFVKLSYVFRY